MMEAAGPSPLIFVGIAILLLIVFGSFGFVLSLAFRKPSSKPRPSAPPPPELTPHRPISAAPQPPASPAAGAAFPQVQPAPSPAPEVPPPPSPINAQSPISSPNIADDIAPVAAPVPPPPITAVYTLPEVEEETSDQAAPKDSALNFIPAGHLAALSGPHAGETFALTPGANGIGRRPASSANVVLDRDLQVSSLHGVLIISPDGSAIYRDDSRNGSRVNGQVLSQGSVSVATGARIEVGQTILELSLVGPSPETAPRLPSFDDIPEDRPAKEATSSQPQPEPPQMSLPPEPEPLSQPEPELQSEPEREPEPQVQAAPEPQPAQQPISAQAAEPVRETPSGSFPGPAAGSTLVGYNAAFEIVEGPDRGKPFFNLMKKTVVLGRVGADLQLSDPTISAQHATLTIDRGRFVLTDNGSTNGTKVNDEPLPDQGRELESGDRITLGGGSTVLVFHRFI